MLHRKVSFFSRSNFPTFFGRSFHANLNYDSSAQVPTVVVLHDLPDHSLQSKKNNVAWTVLPHLPIHILLCKFDTLLMQPQDCTTIHTVGSKMNILNEEIKWCRSVSLLDIVRYTLINDGRLECRTKSHTIPIRIPNFQERSEAIESSLRQIQKELGNLDNIKKQCDLQSEKSANRLVWGGLLGLCAQWGLMARLTWWEYSWDVMEPISYFITFGTAIVGYMFYIITKREYTYEAMTGLHINHKQVTLYKKANLDINYYSELANRIQQKQELLKQIHSEYPSLALTKVTWNGESRQPS